jgi:hypothetical protein
VLVGVQDITMLCTRPWPPLLLRRLGTTASPFTCTAPAPPHSNQFRDHTYLQHVEGEGQAHCVEPQKLQLVGNGVEVGDASRATHPQPIHKTCEGTNSTGVEQMCWWAEAGVRQGRL